MSTGAMVPRVSVLKDASAVLQVENVTKVYQQGTQTVPALRGVSLQVQHGEFLVIMGSSGSGKSTLLHLMGGLDLPSTGEIYFQGREMSSLSDREISRMRRTQIGFVFQFFNLVPSLTAAENVALPLVLDGQRPAAVRSAAEAMLERVGLADRARHWPYQLSGGEMQRVAIARGLISNPQVILADEPTGNLDTTNGHQILEIIQRLREQSNLTIAMVTHDESVAKLGTRVVRMQDGLVVDKTGG